jgi:transmembrane sensor
MSGNLRMPAMDEDDTLRRIAKDWVVRVATGDVTKGDLATLEKWRALSPTHAEAFTQAARLWKSLGPALEAAEKARNPKRAGLLSFTERPTGRRLFLGGAAAASAMAVVGVAYPPFDLWPSFDELTADYRTGTGEQRRVALADHSSVELNTRTSLNVAASSTSDRVQLITGEVAMVAGAKQLNVFAAAGMTSAKQAQFTVRYVSSTVRVTCLGGTVAVACRGQTAAIRPRQQITYDAAGGLGPVVQINPAVISAWQNGLLIFEGERLSRVIEEINRYRSGRIILMNAALGAQRVTAQFKIARLDTVPTQFEAVFGAKVTYLPGGLVLLS